MFAQIGYYICVPFAWLTRLFYTWTGSYGVALILFTLMVKLVLLPFQLKSKKSMLRMGRMNGKVQEIQKKYANNKEKQQQEIADLYAREGVIIIYLVGNTVLMLSYWIIWMLYFNKQTYREQMALAVIPTGIFLLSGITMLHYFLIIFAVIFGIGHIYVTSRNKIC